VPSSPAVDVAERIVLAKAAELACATEFATEYAFQFKPPSLTVGFKGLIIFTASAVTSVENEFKLMFVLYASALQFNSAVAVAIDAKAGLLKRANIKLNSIEIINFFFMFVYYLLLLFFGFREHSNF